MIWDRPPLHWDGPLPEGWNPNVWWTSGPHRGDVPSGCGILAGQLMRDEDTWLELDEPELARLAAAAARLLFVTLTGATETTRSYRRGLAAQAWDDYRALWAQKDQEWRERL